MNKEELYNKALENIHKYSLLNEIFAIRDERFPEEQQDNMLCLNGYIGIDTLNRYVRNIDELVRYQNIGTIKEFKELLQENKQLKERNKALYRLVEWCEECGICLDQITNDDIVDNEEFEKESKNMGYIESMIYYAEKYNKELESGDSNE